mmetsp:Transcript_9106/g.25634  ORF Transcript_9106/g.25634 Transcript_9106/m.25634 type:complete len:239 (+) Transcript_9106:691-1407(+)
MAAGAVRPLPASTTGKFASSSSSCSSPTPRFPPSNSRVAAPTETVGCRRISMPTPNPPLHRRVPPGQTTTRPSPPLGCAGRSLPPAPRPPGRSASSRIRDRTRPTAPVPWRVTTTRMANCMITIRPTPTMQRATTIFRQVPSIILVVIAGRPGRRPSIVPGPAEGSTNQRPKVRKTPPSRATTTTTTSPAPSRAVIARPPPPLVPASTTTSRPSGAAPWPPWTSSSVPAESSAPSRRR